MKNHTLRAPTARDKGEDCCRSCGYTQGLHAHHAVPRSLSREGRRDLRNIVVLCGMCHGAFHRGEPLYRDIFTSEEWNFIRSLIGPGWLDRRYPVRKRVLDW